ncbi:MAG: TatD family deoxyribonuclease [Ruminococcaceae bacterium]|nr:TatD family deoxyribonuclease [Oscillospiraceae bacterium]
MYFDTHAHLDDGRFSEDREAVIREIFDSGVSLVVNVGADMEGSRASVQLAAQYDGIYAAVGVHPYDAQAMTEVDLAALRELAGSPKVVAIGEIGLDYHYDEADRDKQKEWFLNQIKLAEALDLPYIVHDRDAHADCLEVIRKSGYFRGVMHCYSGSSEMARELVELGFYISFAGPVTFKNGKKAKEAAASVPSGRILIETDSPYLSPEPYRGQRNDSAKVRFVAKEIAALKGMTEEELAKVTLENGKRFFGIE